MSTQFPDGVILLKGRRFRGLFVIGEKKVFDQIGSIVELGQEARNIVKEMLNAENLASVSQLNEDVITIEKRADDVAFKTSKDITNGAISSNILDNLLAAVDMADNVVDNFHYISREIKRTGRLRFDAKDLGNLLAFQSQLNELLDLSGEAMNSLRKLLSSKELDQMQSIRMEIEGIEERGDNVKDSAFDKLYFMAPTMHYLQFIHISELLHKMDDILDSCEDISDLVLAVATSISK